MKPKDAFIEPKDEGRCSTSWAEWFPPHGCNAEGPKMAISAHNGHVYRMGSLPLIEDISGLLSEIRSTHRARASYVSNAAISRDQRRRSRRSARCGIQRVSSRPRPQCLGCLLAFSSRMMSRVRNTRRASSSPTRSTRLVQAAVSRMLSKVPSTRRSSSSSVYGVARSRDGSIQSGKSQS